MSTHGRDNIVSFRLENAVHELQRMARAALSGFVLSAPFTNAMSPRDLALRVLTRDEGGAGDGRNADDATSTSTEVRFAQGFLAASDEQDFRIETAGPVVSLDAARAIKKRWK